MCQRPKHSLLILTTTLRRILVPLAPITRDKIKKQRGYVTNTVAELISGETDSNPD